MVQFFQLPQQPQARLAEQMGLGLGQGVNQIAQQQYQRGILQKALGQIKDSAIQGASPLDITLNTMQAIAGIPGAERYAAALIPMIQEQAAAQRAQKFGLPGMETPSPQAPRERERMVPPPGRAPLPGFMGQPATQGQAFPTAKMAETGPGAAPSPATTMEEEPLLSPQQQNALAMKRSAEKTANGQPTTPEKEMQEILASEARKEKHNTLVRAEKEKIAASQREYGERAVSYLEKHFPEKGKYMLTDTMRVAFEKLGEDVSRSGMSEAERNQFLAKKAENFKNAIVTVDTDLDAPRLQNTIHRGLTGKYKNLEQASQDLKSSLKPLLDLGLYDVAREMLQQKGYGIEERDMIVNPLNGRSVASIENLPSITKGRPVAKQGVIGVEIKKMTDGEKENLKNSILDLKKNEPNFSLALARKAYEDKGYTWRDFKNVLNELLDSDQLKLEDDQRNQLGDLSTPPLNFLEKMLHSINIVGR